jgi:hypothetical protein
MYKKETFVTINRNATRSRETTRFLLKKFLSMVFWEHLPIYYTFYNCKIKVKNEKKAILIDVST